MKKQRFLVFRHHTFETGAFRRYLRDMIREDTLRRLATELVRFANEFAFTEQRFREQLQAMPEMKSFQGQVDQQRSLRRAVRNILLRMGHERATAVRRFFNKQMSRCRGEPFVLGYPQMGDNGGVVFDIPVTSSKHHETRRDIDAPMARWVAGLKLPPPPIGIVERRKPQFFDIGTQLAVTLAELENPRCNITILECRYFKCDRFFMPTNKRQVFCQPKCRVSFCKRR